MERYRSFFPLKPLLFAGFLSFCISRDFKDRGQFLTKDISISIIQNVQFFLHGYRMVLLTVAAHWKVISMSSVVRRGTLLLVPPHQFARILVCGIARFQPVS